MGLVVLVLTVLVAAQLALVAYLVLLTFAAALTRVASVPNAVEFRRFAILVPAHNEEGMIARLLDSVTRLKYTPELFDVCVVADNCHDRTADIARLAGVMVFERFDAVDRAKGYALRWLLEQLQGAGHAYDAYVILDADSVIAPNFLMAMNARLEGGATAVQAYYSVLNSRDSTMAGLRFAALAAVHYLRPLGRLRLGLSAGLKGNGMCFSA